MGAAVTIEAELKAQVRDCQQVRQLLAQRADEETSIYADTYYDTPHHDLTRAGRELRVRVIRTEHGTTILLTYKDATVDPDSGSKPETETTVNDADAMRGILAGLGFEELIAFEKHCSNYRFTARGLELLTTVAYVPELDETFIEIESMVDNHAAVGPALDAIRAVLAELGRARDDETTEAYTDAVASRRGQATR